MIQSFFYGYGIKFLGLCNAIPPLACFSAHNGPSHHTDNAKNAVSFQGVVDESSIISLRLSTFHPDARRGDSIAMLLLDYQNVLIQSLLTERFSG